MLKTLTCGKCDRYAYPLRRCRDGLVNPPTYKQTKAAMALMGMGYVCNFNRHKAVVFTEYFKEINGGYALILS